MFESCAEIRQSFSDYVDGECSREIFRSIHYHLSNCGACRRELDHWQAMKRDLLIMPRRDVPPELALRLRVMASRELHQNLLQRLLVRVENGLDQLALPASAGVLVAVICFGIIMGSQTSRVEAAPQIAPAELRTPPRVVRLAPINFKADDQTVVLDTHIDAAGRVTDYNVLSGQRSPELMNRLDRMMFFSNFHPATSLGVPTDGHMVLSLRRITVRG